MKKKITVDIEEKVMDLWALRMPFSDIAKRLNISVSQVRNIVKAS